MGGSCKAKNRKLEVLGSLKRERVTLCERLQFSWRMAAECGVLMAGMVCSFIEQAPYRRLRTQHRLPPPGQPARYERCLGPGGRFARGEKR